MCVGDWNRGYTINKIYRDELTLNNGNKHSIFINHFLGPNSNVTASTITDSENLLSTTMYNYGTVSTTQPGAKSTPGSHFPHTMDLYHSTIFTEPTKTTSNMDLHNIMSITPTNLIQASQYEQSATTSSDYVSVDQQLTTAQSYKATTHARPGDVVDITLPLSNMLQAPHPTTASSATTTASSILPSPTTKSMAYPLVTQTPIFTYPKITSEPHDRTVHRATTEYQHLTTVYIHTTTITSTTTKHHHYSMHIIGSIKKTMNNGPQQVATTVPQSSTTILESEKGTTTGSPTGTEQGIIIDTDPSLATTARKSSQAVTLREAVAWALLALMTLLLIVTPSVVIILRIQKMGRNKTIQ